MKEFKYLGMFFMRDRTMDYEMDRRFGAASAVMQLLFQMESKALDLMVDLCPNPHL